MNLSIAKTAAEPSKPIAAAQLKSKPPTQTSGSAPLLRGGRPKWVDTPVTGIRNVIAKRLTESKQTVPHQYTSVKVDLAQATDMRKQLSGNGVKISMNDLILKATSVALQKVPQLNAVWNGAGNSCFDKKNLKIAKK